jgi:fucose permease
MNQNTQLRDRVYRASCASIFIYSASSIALPICLFKISEELGFNLTQGGSLGFVSSIEMFFVLLASPFAAARFGKIRVLRTALVILACGMVLFTLTRSYLASLFLILFIGLGNGFLEALLTPIVEDLFPNDDGSKMNLLHSFWPVGTCTTVLVLGQLLSVGAAWRWLFVGIAIFILAISFFYPRSNRIALPQSRADFSHMRKILAIPRFWLHGIALFFSGAAEGAFAFWSASYIQIHFNSLPFAGAIGTACFAAGMAIGRLGSSRLAGKIGLKRLILLSTAIGFVTSLSFFLIGDLPALYLFLFVMGLSIACLWPSIQSYSGSELQVDATVLMTFLSCFGIPGYSVSALVMGIIGDAWGLQASFILAPVCLASVVILMSLEKRVR